MTLLICRYHFKVGADFSHAPTGTGDASVHSGVKVSPVVSGMDLTQGPTPVLSYRCFFGVRSMQMPCCCPVLYSVASPGKLLDHCDCILLEMISSHTHWLLCFAVFARNSSCKYSLGLGWVFASREASHKSSLTVPLPSMSLLMVHMASALLLHLYFSYAYICLAVRLSVMLT